MKNHYLTDDHRKELAPLFHTLDTRYRLTELSFRTAGGSAEVLTHHLGMLGLAIEEINVKLDEIIDERTLHPNLP